MLQNLLCEYGEGVIEAEGAPSSAETWLSILIPVYNVAPYVRRCLDSILLQLPPEGVEIILLDDASTDTSLEICVDIRAAHRTTIRMLVRARNGGLSAARNAMLEAARGDYVWFIDSDDEMLPGAIAGLGAVLAQNPPDVILCDYVKSGKHIASFRGPANVFSWKREALVRGLFAGRRMHSWTKISRRALWGNDLRFPVGRCFEDAATSPWLFLRAHNFYYVPHPWIVYRVRSGSITGMISRTRGRFDHEKNDDMARALTGFSAAAETEIPNMSLRTRYYMAQFCAKEFTKIAWRLLSARFIKDDWHLLRQELFYFRDTLERCSPIGFDRLTILHLRFGKPEKAFILGLFLLLVRRSSKAE